MVEQEMMPVQECSNINAPSLESENEAYQKGYDEGFKKGYREGNINGLKYCVEQTVVVHDMLVKTLQSVEEMKF